MNYLLKTINKWKDMKPSEMRLLCGEMTAQEIRSVKAVLECILRECELANIKASIAPTKPSDTLMDKIRKDVKSAMRKRL